ncbi:MAG: YceD family protein [Burkholderiaceae bacterium]|nr:YceD family protein [Burkholderiaceae bacterium]
MSAWIIDAFEFARQNERREGQVAVADLPRLAKESADASGTLRWSLAGGTGKLGHRQLVLSVSVTVQLVCQRCLKPFSFDIQSESVLVLAKDEAEADEIDEMLGDDEIDVIVGSREFDVQTLVEDEALLALPLSPRHEVCPDASALDALSEGKPSPFAALKGIKR